jgi:alpha-mannosidase
VLIEGDGVLLTAFKQAECSDGWILRLFESTGKARTITLCIPTLDLKKEIRFSPFEIKSLCLNEATKTLYEVNLMEQH